jgi:tetratricopeptide (TPR) repeat protein
MRNLLACVAAIAAGLSTPACAAWHVAESKHFVIYSDDDPGRLREFATRLEKFDKSVRIIRAMGDPALTPSRRLTVFVVKNEAAIEKLMGFEGVRGMYVGRAGGSFAFVPRKSGDGSRFDLGSEAVFFHEYAHHLQLQQANGMLPVWFVEGFAEFFATAKIQDDGSVLIGSVPLYRGWGLQDSYTNLSLEQVVGQTFKDLDGAQTERLYALGWLLTHYLTFDASRKGQLEKYLAAIQKGIPPLDAARYAFGDLRKLSQDVQQYKRVRLTALEIAARALKIDPIAVRPLGPGEAAIMSARIRSARGVDKVEAPRVAGDARKVAQAYPDDAWVQTALAEAELDAKNPEAADIAASRALALKPDLVPARMLKGRAQLALAKTKGSAANWPAIRQWFLDANKLDTENAEALVAFYETFAAAGQHPTKNAIEALLYAQDLAPQDEDLRLAAFRQLVLDKRIGEAKGVFAPIAFRPHASSKWRRLSDGVLAALNSGDGKTVLTLLDENKKLLGDN